MTLRGALRGALFVEGVSVENSLVIRLGFMG